MVERRGGKWEGSRENGGSAMVVGGITPLHAGKLDHIGVEAYSTLAGGDIFARDYV